MEVLTTLSPNTSINNSASNAKNSDLEELRNWYQRRSQDFTSTNYLKYIDDQKLLARVEDGFIRFERSLQMEKEKLYREFERKLSFARVCAATPRSSILNDYLEFNERITHSPGTFVTVNKDSTISPMQFVRPIDFCEFSSEGEEGSASDEEDELNENGQMHQTNAETTVEALGEIAGTNNNGSSFSTTLVSESNFCTSTPIKKTQKDTHATEADNIPSLESEEVFCEAEDCQFFKWLHYFADFENKLRRQISAFENDQTKKEFRIELSRTIANRINDAAKKNVSTSEMAGLFNFFQDLLKCCAVESWKEGNKISLMHGDNSQHLFAMETICIRYLEQIKWDNALMENVLLVLVKLCKMSMNFYKIFCAKIVSSVVLLSMDQDKIISKVIGFGNGQPQEAVVQWVNNESIVFRLFCRVQFALRSLHDETAPEMMQGFALLRKMFTSVAECKRTVILSSAFILSELLQFAKLFTKQNDGLPRVVSEHFIPLIQSKVIGKEWHELVSHDNKQRMDECAKKAMSARQSYLTDCLRNSIEKLNN